MTNKNNTKRFANRVTVLKGEAVNLETFDKKPFELTVSYIRAKDKAMEMALEKLELDEEWIINPKTFEVINEKPKPIKYNDGKIYDLCYNRFDNEDEAIKAAEIDNNEMRTIHWYEISAQVWAIDSEGNYRTEWYADETPMNMTKVNARDFMRMSYEDYSGCKVLGIHACEKHDKPMYCIITSANLEKCIEK